MSQQQKLVEGIDYYMEGDSMVFTQRFLLKRGYCCNSGCRHCPYGSDAKPTVGVSIVGLGDSDDE